MSSDNEPDLLHRETVLSKIKTIETQVKILQDRCIAALNSVQRKYDVQINVRIKRIQNLYIADEVYTEMGLYTPEISTDKINTEESQ